MQKTPSFFLIQTIRFYKTPQQLSSKTKSPRKKGMRSKFPSAFSSKKREVNVEVEDIGELESSMGGGRTEGRGGTRLLYPSPLTPAFLKANKGGVIKVGKGEADACRSFENYMVEMIVEEGKMRDLMDVEELLYCWKNLKCPVFKNLVCRFHGELCQDLFSSEGDDWKY